MKYVTIATLFIFLSSCSNPGEESTGLDIGISTTWKNDEIDSALRNSIKKKNETLIQGIFNNDVKSVESLFSELFMEKSGHELGSYFEQINAVIQSQKYELLDEYKRVNLKENENTTVYSSISETDSLNGYTLNHIALNKESYTSLLTFNTQNGSGLLTLIYGLYESEWKINVLHFGDYAINGLHSNEHLSKSKALMDSDSLLAAYFHSCYALLTSKPAGPYYNYRNHDEKIELNADLEKKVKLNYEFPKNVLYTLDSPEILAIYPFGVDKGFFPMINYYTSIDLADSAALRIENDQIHAEIESIFPAIKSANQFLFYRAYNDYPDGIKKLRHFGFVHDNEDIQTSE